MPNWVTLQSRIHGIVTTQKSSDFHSIVEGLTWNEIKPNRLPTAIVAIKNEDDIQDSTRLSGSFTAEKWTRLQQIRSKYDPDGLFFNYLEGVAT